MSVRTKLVKVDKDTQINNAIYKAAMSEAKKKADPLYTKYLNYMAKAKDIRERIKMKYGKKLAAKIKRKLLS